MRASSIRATLSKGHTVEKEGGATMLIAFLTKSDGVPSKAGFALTNPDIDQRLVSQRKPRVH
jgi:hypothetical protein